MLTITLPLQRRMKIHDSPERALHDWLSFAELTVADVWPRRWAEHYVAHSRARVHDWLHAHGLRFLPAVNWVERGMNGDGNSLPRYHVVWGTSRELTRRMVAQMRAANSGGRLTLLHGHRVTALDHAAPPTWTPGDLSQTGLASLSRELSANAWLAIPPLRAGSPLDRNVELLLPAPFDLSAITDAAVETEQMKARAQLTAHGGAA